MLEIKWCWPVCAVCTFVYMPACLPVSLPTHLPAACLSVCLCICFIPCFWGCREGERGDFAFEVSSVFVVLILFCFSIVCLWLLLFSRAVLLALKQEVKVKQQLQRRRQRLAIKFATSWKHIADLTVTATIMVRGGEGLGEKGGGEERKRGRGDRGKGERSKREEVHSQ